MFSYLIRNAVFERKYVSPQIYKAFQLVVEVYSTINQELFFLHILQAQLDKRPSDFPSPQVKFLQSFWTAKNVVGLLVRVKDTEPLCWWSLI